MSTLPPLPYESPATAEDLRVMREQLGRDMRGVRSIARRCACGRPAVVRTAPRLEDGTPFPTSLYLTLPSMVLALSRVEATGEMARLTEELAADDELSAAYAAAHERYLARRAELGSAQEVDHVSAGGMPTRVKCLHAIAGQALAEGEGVNPIADRVLAQLAPVASIDVCRCEETAAEDDEAASAEDQAAGPEAPVAAIDCGTNSIRLLIARRDPETGALVDLVREMTIVRLGYGVDRTGRFDPEAVARTLETTRRYADLIAQHGARSIRFVATSATRDASNRDVFIDGVREILGVEVEVVSGQEEAELSFRGAVSTLPGIPEGPRLVVDIGGGSTELVLGEDAPTHRISLDIGSVRLTERHLRSDPPTEEEIAAARADVDALLDEAAAAIPLERTEHLVGVAGTVTTLTGVALGAEVYSPELSHGARFEVPRMLGICEEVLRMTRAERSARSIIHPGRIDVIGAGALIWERVIRRVADVSTITSTWTSEHDILDGIALSLVEPRA